MKNEIKETSPISNLEFGHLDFGILLGFEFWDLEFFSAPSASSAVKDV